MESKISNVYMGFDNSCPIEEGETITYDGCHVQLHVKGLHSYANPLAAIMNSDPVKSQFAVVSAEGKVEGSNVVSASSEVTVSRKLSLTELVDEAVKYTEANLDTNGKYSSEDLIYSAPNAISSSDTQSVASVSGDWCAAKTTGLFSLACTAGFGSIAIAEGIQSIANAVGDGSTVVASGLFSAAVAIGDNSSVSVEEEDSVALASGVNGRAKACKGSAIVLCYKDNDGKLLHVKSAIVGEGGIKPNTWYSLDENGDFVEEK